MKNLPATLLVLVCVLVAPGCSTAFKPPLARYVSVRLPTTPIGGAVRPTGGLRGRIKPQGDGIRGSWNLGRTHYVDVGTWSNRFAEVLGREYAKRGVVTSAGPVLRVQVTRVAVDRQPFYRYECAVSALVHLDGAHAPIPIEARTSTRRKNSCETQAFADAVARIITHPAVWHRVRAGGRR